MLEQFLNQIVDIALVSVVGLGTFSMALTALLKRVPQLKDIPATTISTLVVLGVFAIALASDEFGYIEQFTNAFEAITAIVVALSGALVGSAGAYQVAKRTNTPILGTSRGDND